MKHTVETLMINFELNIFKHDVCQLNNQFNMMCFSMYNDLGRNFYQKHVIQSCIANSEIRNIERTEAIDTCTV
jgi:hypothetical protein